MPRGKLRLTPEQAARRDAALALAVRIAAERGAAFEAILSCSPHLERRMVELTLARHRAALGGATDAAAPEAVADVPPAPQRRPMEA